MYSLLDVPDYCHQVFNEVPKSYCKQNCSAISSSRVDFICAENINTIRAMQGINQSCCRVSK